MHTFHIFADCLSAAVFLAALFWSCESVGTRVVFAVLSGILLVALLNDFGLIS